MAEEENKQEEQIEGLEKDAQEQPQEEVATTQEEEQNNQQGTSSEPSSDSSNDTTKEETASSEEDNKNKEDKEDKDKNDKKETDEELDGETQIQTKEAKLKKILIIAIAVLGSILIIGIVLYFIGFFDPEPLPQDANATKDINSTKPKKYVFNIKDINKQRLNKRLKLLTKYEILGTAQEELEKEKEKNKKISSKEIKKTSKKRTRRYIATNKRRKKAIKRG